MQFFRNRAVELLFPAECDAWLAVLRFGLGLQVVVYCLSLHRDWTYLFAGKGNSLISRELQRRFSLLTVRLFRDLDGLRRLGIILV